MCWYGALPQLLYIDRRGLCVPRGIPRCAKIVAFCCKVFGVRTSNSVEAYLSRLLCQPLFSMDSPVPDPINGLSGLSRHLVGNPIFSLKGDAAI